MKQLILCLMLAFSIVAPSIASADFISTSTESTSESPGFFSTIGSGISTAFTSIWTGIKDFATWIKESWLGQAVGTVASYIQKGVSTAYSSLASGASKVYEYAKNGVNYVYDHTIGLFKPQETQVAATPAAQSSEAAALEQALNLQEAANKAAIEASEQGAAQTQQKVDDLRNWRQKGLAKPTAEQLNSAADLNFKANEIAQKVKIVAEQAKQKTIEQSRQPTSAGGSQ